MGYFLWILVCMCFVCLVEIKFKIEGFVLVGIGFIYYFLSVLGKFDWIGDKF